MRFFLRWFAGFVGLLGLSALLWYYGPLEVLVVEDPTGITAGILVIGLFVNLWGGAHILKLARALETVRAGDIRDAYIQRLMATAEGAESEHILDLLWARNATETAYLRASIPLFTMAGLLGTLVGMKLAFGHVSATGSEDISAMLAVLGTDIAIAINTTIAGIVMSAVSRLTLSLLETTADEIVEVALAYTLKAKDEQQETVNRQRRTVLVETS